MTNPNEDNSLLFKRRIRTRKECNLIDFEGRMSVDARQASWSTSETVDLQGFPVQALLIFANNGV